MFIWQLLARSCMPCLVLCLISHTLLVYSIDLRAIQIQHELHRPFDRNQILRIPDFRAAFCFIPLRAS